MVRLEGLPPSRLAPVVFETTESCNFSRAGKMVAVAGFPPALLSEPDPKSGASCNFAIPPLNLVDLVGVAPTLAWFEARCLIYSSHRSMEPVVGIAPTVSEVQARRIAVYA
jgi:hypothetical protein